MPRLTDQQIKDRKNTIGSSDVPKILGVSEYQNSGPWDVYNEKAGLVLSHKRAPELERGHDLEPVLLKWYEDETGAKLLPGGTQLLEDWASATIDGKVIGKSALVECKAVGAAMMRQWDAYLDDGIPHSVRVQVAWQMWVANYEEAHIAAMLGGPSGFKIFTIKRDIELEKMIVEGARKFWEMVKSGQTPDLDGSKACREWLASKYPEPVEPTLIPATAELDAVGRKRADAGAQEKASKKEKDRLTAVLIEAMRDSAGIKGETWKMTRSKKTGNYTFTGKGGEE